MDTRLYACVFDTKSINVGGGGEIGEGGSVNGPKVFFIGSKKGQDGKPQRWLTHQCSDLSL